MVNYVTYLFIVLVVISRDATVDHTSMVYVNGIFRYVGVSNTSK
jgi:hypothetical protein